MQLRMFKTHIGQEVSEQLDYIPAKVRVIRNIRYKYACKCKEITKMAGDNSWQCRSLKNLKNGLMREWIRSSQKFTR